MPVDTDDPAKDRAEARAERELQLKIETLELEREKFKYTKRQSNRDRMSAAGTRAAGALMFAHGSMIVVSLTNYKALADLLPPKSLHLELWLLGSGLYFAAIGFILVLTVGRRCLVRDEPEGETDLVRRPGFPVHVVRPVRGGPRRGDQRTDGHVRGSAAPAGVAPRAQWGG